MSELEDKFCPAVNAAHTEVAKAVVESYPDAVDVVFYGTRLYLILGEGPLGTYAVRRFNLNDATDKGIFVVCACASVPFAKVAILADATSR